MRAARGGGRWVGWTIHAGVSAASGSGLKFRGPSRVVIFRPIENSYYMRMMSNGD